MKFLLWITTPLRKHPWLTVFVLMFLSFLWQPEWYGRTFDYLWNRAYAFVHKFNEQSRPTRKELKELKEDLKK